MFIRKKYDVEVAFIEGYATRIVSGSNNIKSKKYAWVHVDFSTTPWTDIAYRNFNEEKQCYTIFDNIFCVSNGVKERFQEKYGVTNCTTQYNPIDENEIIKKSTEFNVDKDANLQLITLGRLVEQKGYDRLLNVVKRIKEEGIRNFNIWILGDGEKKEEYSSFIKENNLQSLVKLLGFQNNPYPYIYNSDAFICSSRSEGFSTVATEALILEKPIFTVECTGMRELFGENECGLIVENTDNELYNLIKSLITNHENMKKYKTGILKQKQNFLLDLRIKEIDKIFDL